MIPRLFHGSSVSVVKALFGELMPRLTSFREHSGMMILVAQNESICKETHDGF